MHLSMRFEIKSKAVLLHVQTSIHAKIELYVDKRVIIALVICLRESLEAVF